MHPSLIKAKIFTTLALIILTFSFTFPMIAFHGTLNKISEDKIDEINILQASILAMHKAIEKLTIIPKHIIVDGNKFKPYKDIPHTTIVKGDAKFMSIAAASVLAKTYRDDFMQKLDKEFPAYFWRKNKGYPTKEHREAIKKYGPTKYHRISFKLLADNNS